MASVAESYRVDLNAIREYAEKRLVSTQRHPTLPLLIHNYTAVCQYERVWDDVTLMCRGLITDLEGNVVARPFSKFFNLEEHDGDHGLPRINWDQPFTATRKMDGSLGVLYFDADGRGCIATRGSFTSDQAKWATAFIQRTWCRPNWNLFNPDWTYLFEILFPENRIVVDYGGLESLVLIDVIDTATGRSIGKTEEAADDIGCPYVDHFSLCSREDLLRYIENADRNEEGLVVRFEDGMRIKLKCAEYKRLHKLITGINSRHIWERLAAGQSFDDVLAVVPDEFYGWVQKQRSGMTENFEYAQETTYRIFTEARDRIGDGPRKDYATHFKVYPHFCSILFTMLDGRDPSAAIWKLVKPDHAVPFRNDGEEA